MSHRKSVLVSAIGAVAAMLATPLIALAATYSDNVAGLEVYASSTEGVFSGAATGSLPGAWSADVIHTVLSGTADITGGNFHLATGLDGKPAVVNGRFEGGSVTQTGGFASCDNQTYDVIGQVADVGVDLQAGKGTGIFRATLTHYRHKFFGHCVIYSASIKGTVSLTF